MKYLLLIPLIVGLAGCCGCEEKGTPIPMVDRRTKESYELMFLFEQDGCKIYRFWDHSDAYYFSNCSGSSVSNQISCGKNCVKDSVIESK